jgi:ABC-type transport system substrate-binding protein
MFGQLLKLFPRTEFQALVTRTHAERHARGFTCWGQFVAMLFCQLGRAHSLREICGGLRSSEGKLKHLGITAPSRSTLAYANAHRPWQLYRAVFEALLARCQPLAQGRRTFRFKNKLVSLDSTVIDLCATLFDWAKFRQAFQWAIDREALHQVAYFGTGSIGYDGIMPGSPFHDAGYKPFKHDMEMAKRLIGESGIATPVTIQAPLQPDPVKQRAGQLFQSTAAALGVKVNIEQIDSAGYRDQLRAGKMPIDLFGWWGYRPDPDQYLGILLHSAGSYAKYHSYSNPKMDELILAERAARSESDRRRAFRQMAELMNEDAVYVPWHYSSDFKGLHPKVKGFVHTQDAITNFEEIWLDG